METIYCGPVEECNDQVHYKLELIGAESKSRSLIPMDFIDDSRAAVRAAREVTTDFEIQVARYTKRGNLRNGVYARHFRNATDNLAFPHHTQIPNIEFGYQGPLQLDSALSIAKYLNRQFSNTMVVRFGNGYNVGFIGEESHWPSMLYELWGQVVLEHAQYLNTELQPQQVIDGIVSKATELFEPLGQHLATVLEDLKASSSIDDKFKVLRCYLDRSDVFHAPSGKTYSLLKGELSTDGGTPDKHGFVSLQNNLC